MNITEVKQIVARTYEDLPEPVCLTVYEAEGGEQFTEMSDAEIYDILCATLALVSDPEEVKMYFAEFLRYRAKTFI